MPKYQSPTFDLVLEKFKEAMTADEYVDEDIRDRVIETFAGDAAVTTQRVLDAIFPPEEEGEEA